MVKLQGLEESLKKSQPYKMDFKIYSNCERNITLAVHICSQIRT